MKLPVMLVCLLLRVGASTGLLAAQTPQFEPTLRFDDLIVEVGLEAESNPFFLFERIGGAVLMDSSTLVHALPGRIVVANLVTGEGWEVNSPRGAAGPGELDGLFPVIGLSGDTIRAITANGVLNTWHRDGTLLETQRFDPSLVFGTGGHPIALHGTRVVLRYQEPVDWLETGVQDLRQGVRIVDLEEQSVKDLLDVVPPVTVRVVPQGMGRANTEQVRGPGLAVAARRDLIVVAQHDDVWIRTFDLQGRERARAEFRWPIESVSIDADGRIWINMDAGLEERGAASLVLDEHLRELFSTVNVRIIDAAGNAVLRIHPGDFGVTTLRLSRPGPG